MATRKPETVEKGQYTYPNYKNIFKIRGKTSRVFYRNRLVGDPQKSLCPGRIDFIKNRNAQAELTLLKTHQTYHKHPKQTKLDIMKNIYYELINTGYERDGALYIKSANQEYCFGKL